MLGGVGLRGEEGEGRGEPTESEMVTAVIQVCPGGPAHLQGILFFVNPMTINIADLSVRARPSDVRCKVSSARCQVQSAPWQLLEPSYVWPVARDV